MTGNDRAGADRRPLLLAGLGAACISASGILIKLADTGAATAAFYRCFLALPLLVALAVAEQRRRGPRPRAIRGGAFVAGLVLSVDLVLWNHAIAEVGAWVLFAERPHRTFLIALPVVLAGVVLVSGLIGSTAAGTHPLAGIGYGMATSVAYATFLLILRRTSAGTPHVAGPLAEATAGAALGAVLLGLAFGGFQWQIGWPSFGWLLLLSVTSQTIGWLLITSSLPRLPAAISSLTLLLQPAAAMLLAAVVLSERPSVIQVAGAVVVCTGVVAASLTAPSQRARAPEQPGLRRLASDPLPGRETSYQAVKAAPGP
jgi:drug/metabolite transporter (DMT)-like permease